jgi:hypothetical protein
VEKYFRETVDQEVGGSSPPSCTKINDLADGKIWWRARGTAGEPAREIKNESDPREPNRPANARDEAAAVPRVASGRRQTSIASPKRRLNTRRAVPDEHPHRKTPSVADLKRKRAADEVAHAADAARKAALRVVERWNAERSPPVVPQDDPVRRPGRNAVAKIMLFRRIA